MRLCVFIIAVLATVLSTGAQAKHLDISYVDCFDTTKEGQDVYGLDGEEMAHADFSKGEYVMTLPEFADPFRYVEGAYETALADKQTCKSNIQMAIKANNYPTEVLEPPVSSIYPRDYVTHGVKNTLICHVTGFYPPALTVEWTKNNKKVTEGMALSQFRPNIDGSYNIFSTLSFTPEQGDIYTCTVRHQGLQQPLTREWDADAEITVPSIGPSVFCGVGLTVGLLGVAVGTFFLVKGNNCN